MFADCADLRCEREISVLAGAAFRNKGGERKFAAIGADGRDADLPDIGRGAGSDGEMAQTRRSRKEPVSQSEITEPAIPRTRGNRYSMEVRNPGLCRYSL